MLQINVMSDEIINSAKIKMNSSIEYFSKSLQKITDQSESIITVRNSC